jgi:hypothetical protein
VVAVEHCTEGEPGQPPVPGFAVLSVLPNADSKSLGDFPDEKIRSGSMS